MHGLVVLAIAVVVVLIVIAKTAVVVPQQSAYVVERLGRYTDTLDAGFHILVPFVDVIRYRHSLKETAHRHPRAGLHHARQRAGAASTASST